MKVKGMYFDGKKNGKLGTFSIRYKGEFIDMITHRECKLEDIEITHVNEAPRSLGFCHWIRTWGLDSYWVIADTDDSDLVLDWIRKG